MKTTDANAIRQNKARYLLNFLNPQIANRPKNENRQRKDGYHTASPFTGNIELIGIKNKASIVRYNIYLPLRFVEGRLFRPTLHLFNLLMVLSVCQ